MVGLTGDLQERVKSKLPKEIFSPVKPVFCTNRSKLLGTPIILQGVEGLGESHSKVLFSLEAKIPNVALKIIIIIISKI
jgi:hypothetical protein